MLGFTIVLVISLPLLAGLQYDWIGQLSDNEHERMKSNLRISADRFAEDFDTELARLTFAFSAAVVPPFDPSTRDVDDLVAHQYRTWEESAPHPRLVQALYLVTPGRKMTSASAALFTTARRSSMRNGTRNSIGSDRTCAPTTGITSVRACKWLCPP